MIEKFLEKHKMKLVVLFIIMMGYQGVEVIKTGGAIIPKTEHTLYRVETLEKTFIKHTHIYHDGSVKD